MISEFASVPFERQLQAIPHELQIAMDGLRADLQLPAQESGVGIFAGLNRSVNVQHPLQGRTGMRMIGRVTMSLLVCLTRHAAPSIKPVSKATRRWSYVSSGPRARFP